MIALYTEIFKDFLERKENSTEWVAIRNLFGGFPSLTVTNGTTSITLNMYNLFKDMYETREICAETEDLFYHFVKDKVQELLLKYALKMKEYISNFSTLLGNTITLSSSETSIDYLQPATSSADKVAGKNTYNKSYLVKLNDKSKIELLNDLLKIKDIYNACVREFNSLFMEIY